MLLDLISLVIKACDLKSDARHALLTVSIELAEGDIPAFDRIVDTGLCLTCQIDDQTVLPDPEADRLRAAQGVALRRSYFFNPVFSVGERMILCFDPSLCICLQGHRFRTGQDLLITRVDRPLSVIEDPENGSLQGRAAERCPFHGLQIQLGRLHAAENQAVLTFRLHGRLELPDIHDMDLLIRKITLRRLRLPDVVFSSDQHLDDIGAAVLSDHKGARSSPVFPCVLL